MAAIIPDGASVLVLVALALALVLVLAGVRPVPQGTELTVERFGRYTRTLGPGLNLIVPFVDRVGTRMNMMEQVLDVPEQEVITRDNAMVKVDGVVFYQVLDAAKAAYEVTALDNAILNLTTTNVRTVIGSLDLDELLSKRDEINGRLLQAVDEATTPWGLKVIRIEIKNITPPKDLVDAMGRQMKAERDKRAAVLQAEGEKAAAILKADGEKQAAVLEAEGRKEAAFRDAEARERLAQAEAAAAAMLSRALAEGNLQAANYFIAQKYLDALAAFAASPNQKTLILPVETTAALGSLAGVAELAREAMGLQPAAAAAAAAAARGPAAPRGCSALGARRPVNPLPWHWLALGGALLVAEALTPGVAFLWLALAAAVTAGLAWLVPSTGWQAQVLGFALAAVASVGCWSWWRRRRPARAADPGLNRRAKSYVGSEAVLVAGIGAGHGRVKVGDTSWAAAGPRLPESTPVRVVGARGAVLIVAPLDRGPAAPDEARGSPQPG